MPLEFHLHGSFFNQTAGLVGSVMIASRIYSHGSDCGQVPLASYLGQG